MRRCLTDKLGLRFKAIKTVNPRTNCGRAMIQRQQFAFYLLNEMLAGKRVINVDEFAVGWGVFVRKGWSIAGAPAKHSANPFGHRLSLLAAVDTDGRTYFAVSQATTDQSAFGTFLYHFSRTLDAEDPDWREHSLILLDGASYHTRKEI